MNPPIDLEMFSLLSASTNSLRLLNATSEDFVKTFLASEDFPPWTLPEDFVRILPRFVPRTLFEDSFSLRALLLRLLLASSLS